jgi:hypothetical protein
MNTQLAEITPLILAGDGYQLTIAPDALARRAELMIAAGIVQQVTSNDESGDAAFHMRNLAQLRIEVEKSRKLVKEPVNRIGKMIDAAAKDFLADVESEENRIKRLIGDHATEVARLKAEKEEQERIAFDAARAAREAAESGGIAAVLAAKKALAERMDASAEVAATNVANGVRFAWDFEVEDMKLLAAVKPDFVEMTERRAVILAWIKALDAGEVEDVDLHCFAAGIRAFKKPVVSSR